MSDLQDIIVSSSIKAFNQGIRTERQRLVKVLEAIQGEVSWDFEQQIQELIDELKANQ